MYIIIWPNSVSTLLWYITYGSYRFNTCMNVWLSMIFVTFLFLCTELKLHRKKGRKKIIINDSTAQLLPMYIQCCTTVEPLAICKWRQFCQLLMFQFFRWLLKKTERGGGIEATLLVVLFGMGERERQLSLKLMSLSVCFSRRVEMCYRGVNMKVYLF